MAPALEPTPSHPHQVLIYTWPSAAVSLGSPASPLQGCQSRVEGAQAGECPWIETLPHLCLTVGGYAASHDSADGVLPLMEELGWWGQ